MQAGSEGQAGEVQGVGEADDGVAGGGRPVLGEVQRLERAEYGDTTVCHCPGTRSGLGTTLYL